KKGAPFILTIPNRSYRLLPGQRLWNRFHVREYVFRGLKRTLHAEFENVEVFGIRGNREIQKVEKDRVKKKRRLTALAPWGVINLVPESVQFAFLKFFRLVASREVYESGDFATEYSVNDYYASEDAVDESLDLLGICKRG
ncbi:MAG: hypothetical protein KGZ25_15340, partial [Planctomycetes bacterium]|nr:hypothetical protein [Planctomycetota bacterium]